MEIDIEINAIKFGSHHRKEIGDLLPLFDSIKRLGLLQAIGITPDNILVFGYRRLAAHRAMGCTTIRARIVELENIIEGAHDENEIRKDYTPSERLAIRNAIFPTIQKREAGWNAHKANLHGHDRVHEDRNRKVEPSEVAAKRAGFSSRETARRAQLVIDAGVPELVEAMDRGDIAIFPAFKIAVEPPALQRELLAQAKPKRKAALRDRKKHDRPKPAPYIRPAAILPTLTREERGYPSPEEEHLPDPTYPHLTRAVAHPLHHSLVQLFPVPVKRAQDARIAARAISPPLRELKKAVQAFEGTQPLPVAEVMAAIETMTGDQERSLVNRLTETLTELYPQLERVRAYVAELSAALESKKTSATKAVSDGA